MTSPSQEPVQPAPLPGLTNVVLLEKIRETPRTIWYRACQEKLGREVLLKARPIGGETLISGAAGAPGGAGPAGTAGEVNEPAAGALARAREEMVLLSRLHSDAIVAAIDASASGPWLYQMVELPPGRPLTRAFQERGRQPWPAPEALAIAERVAEGLEHAHRAGIILRRLHPEDLFLAPDGRVKISSLEWAIGPGISPGFPAEVSWLAPEVAGGATAATAAADSHALGLLLAWLLTGRDPPASGLRRADEKAVEALRTRGAREDVVRLVARLLDPAPENRPAGGAEALEMIRALGDSLSRPRSARRAVIVASAAALILAAALTFALSSARNGAKSGGRSPAARAETSTATSGVPSTVTSTETSTVTPPEENPGQSPVSHEKSVAVPKPAAIPDLRREVETKKKELEAKEKEREKETVALLGAEIDRLLAAGDLEGARRRAEEGSARLTTAQGKQARLDLDARIAREERARAEAAQRLASLVARAREAFEAERFEEAVSTLEGAEAGGSAAAPIRDLSREIAIARAARESILHGLDRAIAGRTPIRSRVYSADGTLSAELELVLDERQGSILTAHQKGNTARMSLSAYDLESAALEALAGPAGGGDAPKELKEGLLALLLSQGRPEAAAPLLAAEDLAAPVRAAYAGREQAVRARRLGELAREATKRLEETSSRKSPPAAWSELKTWVAGIISRNSSGPSYAERAGDLEKVFLASARETFRAQTPDRLFRGRVLKERRNGQVQVLYDFDDPGQAADWIPATKSSRLIPATRAVRFAGSLRFLKGNPFGGSMGVAVKVLAKGIANPPHLGLILGSPRPEEGGKKIAASPEGPPAPAKAPAAGEKPPLPGEAKEDPSPAPVETESPAAAARSGAPLAFVLGFVPPKGEGLEMPNAQGTVQVATPASALFAGAGLPPDPEQVIFAVPTPRHTGPLFVRAEVAPGHLSWTVNGKPVLQSLGEGAIKALAKLSPAETKRLPGSVVLYNADEPVTIDTIEVYGALDERWVEERIEELAREELEGLRGASRGGG